MICDTACAWIARPMKDVFRFMADPSSMPVWNVGTVEITTDADGLSQGRSQSGGAPVYIRVNAHPDQMLIDYAVGSMPEALSPRIFARILPGAVVGTTGSLLLLTAVRTETMDDARWQTLVERHAKEVELVKKALEPSHV